MTGPKFEMLCKVSGGTDKVFSLKNVSSVITSNICAQSFDLIYVDGTRQSLINCVKEFPISLGPNEVQEFFCNHPMLSRRRVGYRELQLVFSAEDEHSNVFRCLATINIEEAKDFALGSWSTQVDLIKEAYKEKSDMRRPTVFISYNWGSDSIADELESALLPYATVLRDKSSIQPWGDLRSFMNSIRTQDYVVLIISDKYLRSTACLYEVLQLMKDEGWNEKAMYLVTDDAHGLYDVVKQVNYINYWGDKARELRDKLAPADPAATAEQVKELKKLEMIKLNIGDFMSRVRDRSWNKSNCEHIVQRNRKSSAD